MNKFDPAPSKKNDDPFLITTLSNISFEAILPTKPTGQGTGFGLSLSYDIIKAHGGEIRPETKEGEGTEFIIKLLLNG